MLRHALIEERQFSWRNRKIRVRHTSLNSALGKQKLVDLYEFEANLVYISEFQASQESYIERPQLKKLGKKVRKNPSV